jgi:hypothetical protein
VPPSAPISSSIVARILHAALVFGVMLLVALVYYISSNDPAVPAEALPERRVLYLGLFVASAALFAAALRLVGRLERPAEDMSQDEWWRINLRRVVIIWMLVVSPAVLGLVAYLLTRDFRTLLATFIGLFLFVQYRPARLTEPS